jgi:hypothetical protein
MTTSDPKSQSTMQEAKQAGAEAAESLRDTAQDAAGKVSAELSDVADKTRTGAARNVKTMAEALHSAADELDDGSSPRRVFGIVAENLDYVSDALNNKDMGEMMRDLNDLARRHPLAFLGGAALAGFAATRLMTASRPDKRETSETRASSERSTPTTPAYGSTPVGDAMTRNTGVSS